LPHLAENSYEGFLQSKSVGFTALETDVNFNKDHKLVLLHDNNLKRLLGIDKDINDLNWEDIENLNIRHEDKISSNNVLTLENLLQEDYGFQTVYLDFKITSKTIADSLLSLMEKYNAYDRFLIADANILFLAYLKFKNPNIQTVLEGFNKGKEWIYSLIPERYKPNYWASFYSEVDESHLSFLKNKQLLKRKIVYGIDKHNIEEALEMGLVHLIVDYHPNLEDFLNN
jgi:glycerophosphoryl diester phosphodiesterase